MSKPTNRTLGRLHKRFHVPPETIPGDDALQSLGLNVRHTLDGDFVNGAKEALIASGIVKDSMFPGDPGMPLAKVNFWPDDVKANASRFTPGHLSITRNPSGKFTVFLIPSCSELDRRLAEHEARSKAEEDAKAQHKAMRHVDEENTERPVLSDPVVVRALLVSMAEQLGIAALQANVDALRHQQSGPRRATGHLSLAWSSDRTEARHE